MSLIYNLYTYLEKIKNKESTFSKIVREEINKGNDDAELIKKTLKYLSNRYYRLSWEEKEILKENNKIISEYFIVALSVFYVNKELNISYFEDAFTQDEEQLEISLPKEKMLKALKSLKEKPLKYEGKDAIKKISINYSYPEWVIKMMVKHFGLKNVYQDVIATKKPLKISLNVNTLLTSKEDVLKYSDFSDIDYLSTGVRYESENNLHDIKMFRRNEVFMQDEVSQLLVDKLNLEMGDESMLISEDNGPIALSMANKQQDIGTINVVNTDMLTIAKVRKYLERSSLKSLNVIQTDLKLLISYVAKDSLDKILFIAPSSNLGLLRKKSSLLLTLNRDELDSLIAYQKQYIKEVSTYLKKGGRMIYAVYTYNKKESSLIVSEFLNENPEFTLIEEKQLFANTLPSDGAYYAIIERKQND